MENIRPEDRNPGWDDLGSRILRASWSRRRFLRTAAAAAAGFAASPLLKLGASRADGVGPALPVALGAPDLAAWPSTNKIKHVVVLCQENRSFDHYFGKFAASEFGTTGDRPDVFDPSVAYAGSSTQRYKPFHLEYFCDYDPDHSWKGSHAKWNGGAMDGWVKAEDDEPFALGFYDAGDHLYHVQLAQTFTLADHFFCSAITQTLPNRLYLWTGTSGFGQDTKGSALPFNNPSYTAPPPTLEWQTMADVLDENKLPWKSYSIADGSLPQPIGAFNPLVFFKQFQSNPARLAQAVNDFNTFFVDLAAGQLPAVSWIVTQATVSEHPPAPPDFGQLLASRVVRALMESSAWDSTALFLTYDEGGGYFEHMAPNILEYVPAGYGSETGNAVGPAFRVPMTVVSPYARRNFVFKEAADHTSVLRFIEKTFSLPATLPIHPARRANLSDMTGAFDFEQEPQRPSLPAPEDLFKLANETVLTSDIHRGLVECGTTVPRWLPPLLGQKSVFGYPSPDPAP